MTTRGTKVKEYRGRWVDDTGRDRSAGPWTGSRKEAKANGAAAVRRALADGSTASLPALSFYLDWRNWPKNVATDTKRTHAERLGVIVRSGGLHKPLHEITAEDVEGVKARLIDRAYAVSHIKAVLATLACLLGIHVKRRHLPENVARGVEFTNADKAAALRNRAAAADESIQVGGHVRKRFNRDHAPRRVGADEFRGALSYLVPYSQARLMVVTCGGFRGGELPLLDRNRVDPATQLIEFDQSVSRLGEVLSGTKNGHGRPPEEQLRKAIIPRPVLALLDATGVHESGRIFSAPNGGLLNANNFRNRVLLPALDAGVKAGVCGRFNMKDLRHTFSSEMHSAGLPVTHVAYWMDHTVRNENDDRVETLAAKTYDHPGPEHAALAAEVMVRYLGLTQQPLFLIA